MNKQTLMRLLGIVLLVILLTAILLTSSISFDLGAFIDLPSIIMVISFTLSALMFSGVLPDYFRAISVVFGKTEFTLKELKSSAIAVDTAIKLCLSSGFLGSVIGCIQILRNLSDPSQLGAAVASVLLTLFYALFINIIQYSMKANIKKEIIYKTN